MVIPNNHSISVIEEHTVPCKLLVKCIIKRKLNNYVKEAVKSDIDDSCLSHLT